MFDTSEVPGDSGLYNTKIGVSGTSAPQQQALRHQGEGNPHNQENTSFGYFRILVRLLSHVTSPLPLRPYPDLLKAPKPKIPKRYYLHQFRGGTYITTGTVQCRS